MIQPTALLTPTTSLLPLVPPATGDAPAFDLSLAIVQSPTLPPMQPLAAPGNALPPVPPTAITAPSPVHLVLPSATLSQPQDDGAAIVPSVLPPGTMPLPSPVLDGADLEPAAPVRAKGTDTSLMAPMPFPEPQVRERAARLMPGKAQPAGRDHAPEPNGETADASPAVTPVATVPARDQPPTAAVTSFPVLDLTPTAVQATSFVSEPFDENGPRLNRDPTPNAAAFSPPPSRALPAPPLQIEPFAPAEAEPDTIADAHDRAHRAALRVPAQLEEPSSPQPAVAQASPEGAKALPDVPQPATSPVQANPVQPDAAPTLAPPPAANADPAARQVSPLPPTVDDDVSPRPARPATQAVARAPVQRERMPPVVAPAEPGLSDRPAALDTCDSAPVIAPPTLDTPDRTIRQDPDAAPPSPTPSASESLVEVPRAPAPINPTSAPPEAKAAPDHARSTARTNLPAIPTVAAPNLLPTTPAPGGRTTFSPVQPSDAPAPRVEGTPTGSVPAPPILPEHRPTTVAAPTRPASVEPSPRAEPLPTAAIERGAPVIAPAAYAAAVPLPVAVPPIPAAAPVGRSAARDLDTLARTGDVATRVALPVSEAPLLVAGTTAPAFRLFAAAIHAARAEESERTAALSTTPPAAVEQLRGALAVASAEGTPLDMTDRRWPHAMVERIERLQDQVSATRDAATSLIRLVPDALGTIDVGVRRDGDAVHVHFTAESAQTRALLADAQPRLQELAEAKGMRLVQTNVGTGTDGQGHRPPASPPPTRTAPASAVRDDDLELATTDRVA